MLEFTFSVGVALALSCAACSAPPARSKHRGPCPMGTVVVDGKHCVPENRNPCPEGFEYDASRKACVFLCPDASVDADVSPFCPPDAGSGDAAP